jgi:hypothetical protein
MLPTFFLMFGFVLFVLDGLGIPSRRASTFNPSALPVALWPSSSCASLDSGLKESLGPVGSVEVLAILGSA